MYSPLGYAASIGNGEVVRVLLTVIKANPNLPKHYGEHNDKRPPVVAAAAGGHINVLRAIANTQGCDVDAAGPGGYTACYGSAQMGMTACLRLLLEAGADPNKAIIDGTTPAMKASLNHNMDCLNLLIDYGCDPHHVKDGRFPSVLYCCCPSPDTYPRCALFPPPPPPPYSSSSLSPAPPTDGMILPLHPDDCDESYHRGLFHENQLCARHRCISWEEAVVQESKRLHTGTTHKGKAVSSSLFAKAKK
jgi:hypothetical protein